VVLAYLLPPRSRLTPTRVTVLLVVPSLYPWIILEEPLFFCLTVLMSHWVCP
jgi:hypothetical protein